jgi:AraC-like DNA-binding protein
LLHVLAYQYGVHFWYSRSVGERHVNESADNYFILSHSAVQVLDLLMNEAAEKKPHFESVAKGLLATLFAVITREIESGNYTQRGIKKALHHPSRPATSFAEQVQEYLAANCHRELKVEDAATHLYMSKSQFSRRVRQETGTTFVELLSRARIDVAQQMLRETDLTSNAIAGSLGFRSSTHFHAVFRARMGCTPIKYRHRTQNQADSEE